MRRRSLPSTGTKPSCASTKSSLSSLGLRSGRLAAMAGHAWDCRDPVCAGPGPACNPAKRAGASDLTQSTCSTFGAKALKRHWPVRVDRTQPGGPADAAVLGVHTARHLHPPSQWYPECPASRVTACPHQTPILQSCRCDEFHVDAQVFVQRKWRVRVECMPCPGAAQ